MASVFLDRTDDNRFSVRVLTGIKGDKTTIFDTYAVAYSFACQKMGKRNATLIDTTAMTPEQLREHRARQARARTILATIRPGDHAAAFAEETGIPYERALVMCNMD